MKHIRKALVAILLLGAVIAQAQKVSEEQALQIAGKFFSSTQNPKLKKMTAGKPRILKTTLTPTSGEPALYVVGNEGSGYVLVSAEESTSKAVLAYSDAPLPATEEDYPEPMKYWLEEYARQVEFLRQQGASPRKTLTGDVQGAVVVAPLLGKTEWDQEEPYNNFCPMKGEERCPTGCLATALAQIMRFYQWPKQGAGKIEYEWYNTFLEADFSKSTYRWDLMKDNYYEEEYSQESQDAVAKLMSDIGLALKMNYAPSGSGAYDEDVPHVLADNFGYDKGIVYEKRPTGESGYVKGDSWDQMLCKELDEGRPIYYAGGGHAFVCDGYDSEGYFHFNFGWGGYCNGWFVTIAIKPDDGSKGYTNQAVVYTHIQPDGGGFPYLRLSNGGWTWSSSYGIMSVFDVTVENALCIENNLSGKHIYTTPTTMDIEGFQEKWADFKSALNTVSTLKLEDGSYTMWPVCRIQGTSEWQRPQSNSTTYVRDYFDVTVVDGVVTIDYPDEFSDENFKYKFVGDAEVSITQWLQESGSREITYPSTVEYKGKTYPITMIDWNGAPPYSITKVTIPASVKCINTTFREKKTLNTVVFEEGSCLREIGSSAFARCIGLTHIDLPESLEIIGSSSFSGCENLQSIHIPKHVKRIEDGAFSECAALKSLTFAPDCELEIIGSAFGNCNKLEGDLVFPSELRECWGHFMSPYITSADFGNTKLRILACREDGLYSSAFTADCTNLKTLILPPTLKKIGGLSLPLEAFNIPDNVEYIQELNVPKAKFLTIPANCDIANFTIAKGATVVCLQEEPKCTSLIPARNSNDITTLYVPEGSYQAYKNFSRDIGRSTYKITAEIIEMLPETDMNMSAKNGEAFILGQNDAEGVLELPSTVVVEDGTAELNVTSIASYAFYGNNAITCVDIPASIGGVSYPTRAAGNGLEGMGEYAFANCSKLNTVIVHWDEPLSITSTAFEGDPLKDMTLVVPTGLVEKYRTAEVWKEFGTITDVPVQGVSSPSSFAATGKTIYDLQGRPVLKTAKGIYIVGGRKVVFSH